MPSPPHIRVLLVDDNPSVLRRVAEVLPDDIEIVDALETGGEVADAIARYEPDVIVLDITLPGESGLEIAAALQRQACGARIVFLTVHEDPDYVRAAEQAGGLGYVLKLRLSLDLEQAVRAVALGRRFVSPVPELSGD